MSPRQNTFNSVSPEETQALGRQWGQTLETGWVLGLSGDLGAGKTQLVKGIASGLGFSGKVQSPTFALINEYNGGRMPMYHLDLYRLETREQIIAAGLEDYLYKPKGIAVVEWIDRWLGEQDRWHERCKHLKQFRLVKLEVVGETERRILYEDFGA